MREIKFRAWDKELKVMVYDNEITGHIEYDTNAVRAINIMLNEDDYGLEFMQYTGLKDKNGTEICEGDILSYKHTKFLEENEGGFLGDTKNYNRNYAIEYSNTYYRNGYRLRNKSIHFPASQATINNGECEVIGNIYENPELLEGVKNNGL